MTVDFFESLSLHQKLTLSSFLLHLYSMTLDSICLWVQRYFFTFAARPQALSFLLPLYSREPRHEFRVVEALLFLQFLLAF